MSLSMFETTYFSGTEGCSTRMSVPDREVEGISQLAPHTSAQPQKKGTRNCHRRRRTIPLICAKSSGSCDSCSSSSIATFLKVWPTDMKASQKTDSGSRRDCQALQTVLESRGYSPTGARHSSQHYAPERRPPKSN